MPAAPVCATLVTVPGFSIRPASASATAVVANPAAALSESVQVSLRYSRALSGPRSAVPIPAARDEYSIPRATNPTRSPGLLSRQCVRDRALAFLSSRGMRAFPRGAANSRRSRSRFAPVAARLAAAVNRGGTQSMLNRSRGTDARRRLLGTPRFPSARTQRRRELIWARSFAPIPLRVAYRDREFDTQLGDSARRRRPPFQRSRRLAARLNALPTPAFPRSRTARRSSADARGLSSRHPSARRCCSPTAAAGTVAAAWGQLTFRNRPIRDFLPRLAHTGVQRRGASSHRAGSSRRLCAAVRVDDGFAATIAGFIGRSAQSGLRSVRRRAPATVSPPTGRAHARRRR